MSAINTMPKAKLENSMEVACVWDWEAKKEVQCSYNHVQEYFTEGLELKKGDTVFDLGANIGLFMLSVFERCEGDVDVYAFEPIPVVFNALQENAQAYNAERLKVFPYGVSSRCTNIQFAYYAKATGFGTAYPDMQNDEIITPMINAFDADLKNDEIQKWPIYIQEATKNSLDKALSEKEQMRLKRIQAVLGFKNAFKPEMIDCEVVNLSYIIDKYQIKEINILKMHVEKSELDILNGINNQDWDKIKQFLIQIEGETQINAVTEFLKKKNFNHITMKKKSLIQNLDSYLLFAKR